MSPSGMALSEDPKSNFKSAALSSQRESGSGHSLHNTLRPPGHRYGRQPWPTTRHCPLETIAERLSCPHQAAGCGAVLAARELEQHEQECIFRDMTCSLRAFNNCSWTGKLAQLMDHFRQKHPSNCNIFNGSDMHVGGIREDRDLRYVYLIAQTNLHFLITIKTDTVDKAVHICIQYIGSKKEAQRYIYEINISSIHDTASRVVFVERCFDDTIEADDIFRQGQCASLPFKKMRQYVEDEKLAFKLVIKREATLRS